MNRALKLRHPLRRLDSISHSGLPDRYRLFKGNALRSRPFNVRRTLFYGLGRVAKSAGRSSLQHLFPPYRRLVRAGFRALTIVGLNQRE